MLNRGAKSIRRFSTRWTNLPIWQNTSSLEVQNPQNRRTNSSFRSILGLFWVKTTSLSGHPSRFDSTSVRRRPKGDCIIASKVVLMCWRCRRRAPPIVWLYTDTNLKHTRPAICQRAFGDQVVVEIACAHHLQYTKFIILNTKSIMFNTKSIIFNTKSIIFNTNSHARKEISGSSFSNASPGITSNLS